MKTQAKLCVAVAITMAACTFTPVPIATAQESLPDLDSLIREVDQLYRAENSYCVMEMTIHTPHWERTLAMTGWSEGTKKTLIRITAPEKENGTGTLRIGNEMWNYLPKTNKVIRIPPSMMMGSWMGSDFTNDDLVKENTFFEDYDFEFESSNVTNDSLFLIKCIPHKDLAVVWGHVIIAVERDGHLPVWLRYYDEDSALIKTLTYSSVQSMGGRLIPTEMKVVPASKDDQWTLVRYMDAEFNTVLDRDMFSLRRLRTVE